MVNWSQHPLQDPIHKGRSVFHQSPGIIGIEVYVQWAILCRRWRHGTFYSSVWKELHMAPLTRAQMKQLAEDALRAVQEWLTAIPREILKKLSPDSLFYVLRPNPLWPLRRFTTGKLGQTSKANLQILNERRLYRDIIFFFSPCDIMSISCRVLDDTWT